jgi:hypothetical protein
MSRELRVSPPVTFFESLEPRLLLDGQAPTIELCDASPALFAENQGQWADASVHYAFQRGGAGVAFTDTGLAIRVTVPVETGESAPEDGLPDSFRRDLPPTEYQTAALAVRFEGAAAVAPTGLDRQETLFNYFVGDQANWRSEVATFAAIGYAGLYDGIDLEVSGDSAFLKYAFHVSPGADWRQIGVTYDGAAGPLEIGAAGDLVIHTTAGDLVDRAPVAWQEIGGQRVDVAVTYQLLDADTVGFAVSGGYDPSAELVIDPDLAWATYLGESLDDYGYRIALDAAGNAYVTGSTNSAGWATAGAYNTALNGSFGDVFVAKLDPTGSALLYATYLGGSDSQAGLGIAVDAAGNAYVTGRTTSAGWATAGAYDTTCDGGWDAFVAKLSPTGSSLLYATYLGGSDYDEGYGIALDAAGNAYVTGFTSSSGWATAGAYDSTFNGGTWDVFVAKLSPAGSSLLYATYLGGSGLDVGLGIAMDAAGNAYLTGQTSSAGWATEGAYDTIYNGDWDAFVAKLDPAGSSLLYATYLGGSDDDRGVGIAVDAAGDAYVTGETSSVGWATAGAYNSTFNGGACDAFVAKLSSTGSSLLYATYLGGSDDDHGVGIAVDAAGNAYVTGYTYSSGWATTGAYDTTYSDWTADVFVAKVKIWVGGVTVLVHGFDPWGKSDSPRKYWDDGRDRVNRLLARLTADSGEDPSLEEYDPVDGTLKLVSGTVNGGERVILFDWLSASNNWESGQAEAAGDALFTMLVQNGIADLNTKADPHIHFIGHSRGTVVVSEAVQRLGVYGIPVDYVTNLDPHDFEQDGVGKGIPLDEHFHDPAVQLWDNVKYMDNFYQQSGTDNDPTIQVIGLNTNPEGRSIKAVREAGGTDINLTVPAGKPGFSAKESDNEQRPDSTVIDYYWGTLDLVSPPYDNGSTCERPAAWYQGMGKTGENDGSNFGYECWVKQGGYAWAGLGWTNTVNPADPWEDPDYAPYGADPWTNRDVLSYGKFTDANRNGVLDRAESADPEGMPDRIFSGDFDLAHLGTASPAGWSYHGGSLSGTSKSIASIRADSPASAVGLDKWDSGDKALCLQGSGGAQATHNRFVWDPEYPILKFDMNAGTGTQGGHLIVTVTPADGVSPPLAPIDVPLNPTSGYVSMFLPFDVRGRLTGTECGVYTLTFDFESTIPSAAIRIDNVDLVSSAVISFDAKTPARYVDEDGDIVKVSLTGVGAGTLTLEQAGAKSDALGVTLTGTSSTSALTITTPTGKTTRLSSMTMPGLKSITAATTGLTGTMQVTGNLSALTLGDVANATLIVTGDIGTVKAIRWLEGSIQATRIGTIALTGVAATRTAPAVLGNLGADVTLTGGGTKAVLGTLTVAGWLDAATISSVGPLGRLTVGGMRDATISTGDVGTHTLLSTLTISGIKGETYAFHNSNVSAWAVGTLTLRDVQTNNAGHTPQAFGVQAHSVATYTRYAGKTVAKRGSKLTGPAAAFDPVGDYSVQPV